MYDHYLRYVENALKELDRVKKLVVRLEEKSAILELTQDIQDEILITAIDDTGYNLIRID